MQRQTSDFEWNVEPEMPTSESPNMKSFLLGEQNKVPVRPLKNKNAEEPIPFTASTNDVLCGRGSVINKHEGNKRFRRIIAQNKKDYDLCKKNIHKCILAFSIVAAIERQGGRFLRKDENLHEWVKISRKDAVAKTTQALRDQLQVSRKFRRVSSSSVERVMETKKKSKSDRDTEEQQSVDTDSVFSDDDFSNSSDDEESMETRRSVEEQQTNIRLGAIESLQTPTQNIPNLAMFNPLRNFPPTEGQLRLASWVPSVGLTRMPQLELPSRQPLQQQQRTASNAGGNYNQNQIWVPHELEALMLSEPAAVEAIATL